MSLRFISRMAMTWAASSPLQSEAPRPYIRPSYICALNGGNFHFSSSSTGTTSVWDMNMSLASELRPSIRDTMLPRSGVRPRISDSMPSSARKSLMYSQTGVSSPVGMNPVFTDGILTRSRWSAILVSMSIWANMALRSGILVSPIAALW